MNKESLNYIQAENRKQQMFFPPSIDEYISSDNPVRAIDDYVELLNIKDESGSGDSNSIYFTDNMKLKTTITIT